MHIDCLSSQLCWLLWLLIGTICQPKVTLELGPCPMYRRFCSVYFTFKIKLVFLITPLIKRHLSLIAVFLKHHFYRFLFLHDSHSLSEPIFWRQIVSICETVLFDFQVHFSKYFFIHLALKNTHYSIFLLMQA